VDFTGAKDDGMAVASAVPYGTHCIFRQTTTQQYLTTQFLKAGCPSCRPSNSVKAHYYIRAAIINKQINYN